MFGTDEEILASHFQTDTFLNLQTLFEKDTAFATMRTVEKYVFEKYHPSMLLFGSILVMTQATDGRVRKVPHTTVSIEELEAAEVSEDVYVNSFAQDNKPDRHKEILNLMTVLRAIREKRLREGMGRTIIRYLRFNRK
jgi:hypothetical protein